MSVCDSEANESLEGMRQSALHGDWASAKLSRDCCEGLFNRDRVVVRVAEPGLEPGSSKPEDIERGTERGRSPAMVDSFNNARSGLLVLSLQRDIDVFESRYENHVVS